MQYFKVNYQKLANLHQCNFLLYIVVIIIMLIIITFLSFHIKVSKKIEDYGIYNDGVIAIKIKNELSDIYKNNHTLSFNNIETDYKIKSYGAYEIINNEVYQEIFLEVDNDFYNQEVGLVVIHYDKERLIKFIWKLFK